MGLDIDLSVSTSPAQNNTGVLGVDSSKRSSIGPCSLRRSARDSDKSCSELPRRGSIAEAVTKPRRAPPLLFLRLRLRSRRFRRLVRRVSSDTVGRAPLVSVSTLGSSPLISGIEPGLFSSCVKRAATAPMKHAQKCIRATAVPRKRKQSQEPPWDQQAYRVIACSRPFFRHISPLKR